MVAGEKAKFLRGSKMPCCPQRRVTAAWTASSVTVPARPPSPGPAVLGSGSALVTRAVANSLASGDRVWLSLMNLHSASRC